MEDKTITKSPRSLHNHESGRHEHVIINRLQSCSAYQSIAIRETCTILPGNHLVVDGFRPSFFKRSAFGRTLSPPPCFPLCRVSIWSRIRAAFSNCSSRALVHLLHLRDDIGHINHRFATICTFFISIVAFPGADSSMLRFTKWSDPVLLVVSELPRR